MAKWELSWHLLFDVCLSLHFHGGRASTPRRLLFLGAVRLRRAGGSASSKPPGEMLLLLCMTSSFFHCLFLSHGASLSVKQTLKNEMIKKPLCVHVFTDEGWKCSGIHTSICHYQTRPFILFPFLLPFIMGNVYSVWKIPFFEVLSQVTSTHGWG